MGFDHELEAFVRLSRQNITEPVGVARNVTSSPQLRAVEPDAESLRRRTLRIKTTQQDGKSFIVENPVNEYGVTGLQSFSIVSDAELWTWAPCWRLGRRAPWQCWQSRGDQHRRGWDLS